MARPIRTALQIATAASELAVAERPDIGYTTMWLAQTSLPYVQQAEHVWSRKNGHLKVTLQAGTIERDGRQQSVGLPYGIIPRLLFHHMCTQAVLTQQPEIDFGDSLAEFLRRIGMQATGGKNGTITRLREQAQRLLRATLTIEWTGDPRIDKGRRLNVVNGWELAWLDEPNANSPYQVPRRGSKVVLATDFFNEILAHPVPFHPEAIRILSGSPLRLDIYIWLTYRMATLRNPVTLTWDTLLGQFGSDVADTKQGRYKFKTTFTTQLEMVLEVYRDANVEVVKGGIVIKPSLTHVPLVGARHLRALGKGDGDGQPGAD